MNDLGFLDRNYSTSALVKAIARKATRKILGYSKDYEPAYRYGITVFDRHDLNGGGSAFGQDYLRVLRDLRLPKLDRVFELCSGPGYIGYSILAHGFCNSLCLADINPEAVEAARKTAEFNNITDRVSVYLSDGLDGIPDTERWDLVVSNPPHFVKYDGNLLYEDPDWRIHRKFYANVKRFLNPGGLVLLQENGIGAEADVFAPMIKEAGGEVVRRITGPDLGEGGKVYYLLSRWG